MSEKSPEWIIKFKDSDRPKSVEFKNIFKQRDNIESVCLLWDTNSYYINIKEKYFIINGGRRITLPGMDQFENTSILYSRRNSMQLSMCGDAKSPIERTYLLGINGTIGETEYELMLHISPDGSSFYWRNKR